jgi:hypothetical protein
MSAHALRLYGPAHASQRLAGLSEDHGPARHRNGRINLTNFGKTRERVRPRPRLSTMASGRGCPIGPQTVTLQHAPPGCLLERRMVPVVLLSLRQDHLSEPALCSRIGPEKPRNSIILPLAGADHARATAPRTLSESRLSPQLLTLGFVREHGSAWTKRITRRPRAGRAMRSTRIHTETATFELRASEVVSPRPGDQLTMAA